MSGGRPAPDQLGGERGAQPDLEDLEQRVGKRCAHKVKALQLRKRHQHHDHQAGAYVRSPCTPAPSVRVHSEREGGVCDANEREGKAGFEREGGMGRGEEYLLSRRMLVTAPVPTAGVR